MALITKEDVRKLARISAIKVDEDQLEVMTKHLEAVLNYASSLKEIAEQKNPVVDLLHTVNRVREDEASCFDAECLLGQAPEREGNFFVVPVIIKQLDHTIL